MIVINYQNLNNEPHSVVKAILHSDSDLIEFDVFLVRLQMGSYGKDVTVNWQTPDFITNGTFYTDANALKMVKRESR